MMASFVAILGGFSSCQDYTEEVKSELLNKLETQNTTLEQALEAQKQALEAKLAELQTAQEACKAECAEKMSQLEAKWNAELAAQVALLKAELSKLAEQIAAINGVIGNVEALEAKIAELQAAQEACKAECAEKMSQLDAKWSQELAAQVALLKAEDSKLAEQIAAINGVIGNVEDLGGKTVVEQIVALNKVAAAVNDTILAWGPRLTAVEKQAADAYNQATVNKEAIENLESIADAHKEQIEGLTQALKDSVAAIQAQAQANLEAAHKYADDQIAVMMGNVSDSLAEVKEEILGSIANVQNDLLDSLASVNAAMLDSVSQLTETMALADKVLAGRLDSVEARVDSLEDQVAKNTKAIENLTGALKKLVTSVVLQGTKNPVMGSIATPFNTRSNILAAYYGSVDEAGLEFPTAKPRFFVDAANVQLTAKDIEMLGVDAVVTKDAGSVLLGDEGNAGTLYMTVNPNTVDFKGLNVSLVNSQDEFSGAELSGLAPSNEVLSFGYTRAAKNGFYEAKATITPATLSDVKLSLNFNEIKEVAKDVAQDIRDRKALNVSKLASTVANTMSAFAMDANGVKVSWTDDLCEEEHSTYSQYGVAVTAVKPLSMAFGSDFNFKKVPGVEKVENFIGRMLDKTVAKLNSAIPDFSSMSFSTPTIKKIKIDELNPDSFKITINIIDTVEYELNMDIEIDDVVVNSVNGQTESIIVTVPEKTHHIWNETVGAFEDITIPEYEITVPSSNFVVDGQIVHINDVKVQKVLEIPVSFTHVEDIYPIINDLYANIVGSIEDVNDMLDELEAFMDDVNKMLDELNKIKDITAKVDDAKDSMKGKISEYLDKFNDKFCALLNSTNKVLRPVMFVNTDKGIVKLSQAKSNPTVINGTTLGLIPTSYSLEYLAPAYKKIVGVTNVYKGSANAQNGDASCVAALNKVNSQANVAEVLAGDTYKVNATFEPGYVYEVVYTAVDFYGKVDAKKFYVTVK